MINGHIEIYIRAPQGPVDQPTTLRRTLDTLRWFNWRAKPGGQVKVTLEGWNLTADLIECLWHLPELPCKATLVLSACKVQHDASIYQALALIPQCYRLSFAYVPETHPVTSQHVIAICQGAVAREQGGSGRLVLVLKNQGVNLEDSERSEVEACVDEHGLGKWVVLEW